MTLFGSYPTTNYCYPDCTLQVKLTDQLLMLDAMLGDCETSEGRVLVKAVVAQVRALGTRLLRFSSQ